ncbi:RNA polymerase sigma-70 factor [Zobellia galactanivorans]|uniref:RNA polymerase sigma factor n=1 Tax=Zobellia galactanivorans (strain DSM 12802 / CCUG 47099 / CIP 106680 / NCIMB 13871 / Dsij) TaxID=63186 RepID=UPI001C06F092|nr:RNA polymerase sigma-70 factor [Zobellia galactanivorans]MBU3026298.1 RNA polymerase sigma-70 factor [Zobellia galactanivorans]MDO6807707.1 RNA polymerase sigma-70 factor [Zobellia galactanivorans]
MNNEKDIFLIERLKNGEEEAFIYLVDHYNRRLYGYALTLTNNHALAEDILQNVFLRTWEQRKKISITASLQNYLFKSVHNEFINQYKKKRSTMVLEQKYFNALEKATAAHDDISLEGVISKIKREIENLPPKCKEVFLLSRNEGLTNLEIAHHLNVSIKTVEAQITKAFSTLRKELATEYKSMFFVLYPVTRPN